MKIELKTINHLQFKQKISASKEQKTFDTNNNELNGLEAKANQNRCLIGRNEVQNRIIELEKSLDNIPQEKDAKAKFIENFLQTDFTTGEQTTSKSCYIKPRARRWADFSNTDLKLILNHSIKISQLEGKNNPSYTISTDIDTLEKIKDRDLYNLAKKRKIISPNENIKSSEIEKLGSLQDGVYDLVKDYITDCEIPLNSLADFALNTEKNSINYIIMNDLLNTSYIECFNDKQSLINNYTGLEKSTIEKIHKSGLLKKIPQRDECLNFSSSIELINGISDENLENLEKRGLLSLKLNNRKFLQTNTIIDLANLSDEAYSRIESRKLFNVIKDKIFNLKPLAELNDEEFKKLIERKIPIGYYTYDKKTLRGLLDLNSNEWDNLEKRKLNAVDEDNIPIYNPKIQIRLAKLDDEQYRNAKIRRLLQDFGELVFGEKEEFLAKLSDEQYELYKTREIEYIGYLSTTAMQELLDMTEEEFKRVDEDIIPLVYKNAELKKGYLEEDPFCDNWKRKKLKFYEVNDNDFQYYKLAYLDESDYKKAIEFVNLEYLKTNQFNVDEIKKIIQLEPKKINALKNILLNPENLNKIPFKKETLLKLVEMNSSEFDTITGLMDCLYVSQIESYIDFCLRTNIHIQDDISNDKKELITKIQNSDLSDKTIEILIRKLIMYDDNYYQKISLEDKAEEILALRETKKSKVLDLKNKDILNIKDEIIRLQTSINQVISLADVSRNKSIEMIKGFFANNNPQLDNLLKTADYSGYEAEGLPLTYPRDSFLNDLNSIFKNLTSNEKTELLDKLNISAIENKGKIIGYDGIIDLSQLKPQGIEGEVLKIANRFIKENSVATGNNELDKALNSLISGMPEFINTIGKKQHSTHDYTLDIHILTVLKEAMKNPLYEKLTNEEKFALKLTAVLHDISKAHNTVDKEHPHLSALYARDILNRNTLTIDIDTKNRIYELIKNHHWLESYNKQNASSAEIAGLFRKKGDLKIARILSEADLKGVKKNYAYFETFKDALSSDKLSPIEDEIRKINTTGQIFLPNKIINPKKVPKVQYKGKTYQVIDFTKLNDNEDLSKFGFEPNSTKKNLRLLVHTIPDNKISDLKNVYYLKDASKEGFLCTSYISIDKHPTYYNYKYGASLETLSENIANATKTNQNSGSNKRLKEFINFITEEESYKIFRSQIPNSIKKTLSLSDSEYCSLYEKIQDYKFISQLDDDRTISIGNKTLSAKQIKEAIINANDSIIRTILHNEVNIYTPKINALIAKENSIEEVPQELFDYSLSFNVPLFIIGE